MNNYFKWDKSDLHFDKTLESINETHPLDILGCKNYIYLYLYEKGILLMGC